MKGSISKIHREILDTKRVNLFTKLSRFKRIGYLAGGTALALQLGHRRSVDFDIFIKKSIDNRLRRLIKSAFYINDFSVNTSDMMTFLTSDKISITFVWYYYPLISKSIPTESLYLASIEDIAADKAITIGRRAVWRDYVDLFYLLHEKILTLEKIIALAKKKFKEEFSEVLFVQQLSYFKDFEIVPIDFVNKSFTAQYIQSFLEKQVEEYVKKTVF